LRIAHHIVQHQRRAIRGTHDECGFASARPGHDHEFYGRIVKSGPYGVDGHQLFDLGACAGGRDDANRRIAILPDLRVEPVFIAGYDQKRRAAERFEPRHFLVIQRDRAEYYQPRAFEPHDGHAPRQIHHRHADLADDGHDIFIDLREFAVRQDFLLF
jgi:hypothetical protein